MRTPFVLLSSLLALIACSDSRPAEPCDAADTVPNYNGSYLLALTKTSATGSCEPSDVSPSAVTLVVSGVTAKVTDWANAPCEPLAGTINPQGGFSASCAGSKDSASITGTVSTARSVTGTASISVRRELMLSTHMCDVTFTVVSK